MRGSAPNLLNPTGTPCPRLVRAYGRRIFTAYAAEQARYGNPLQPRHFWHVARREFRNARDAARRQAERFGLSERDLVIHDLNRALVEKPEYAPTMRQRAETRAEIETELAAAMAAPLPGEFEVAA